MPAAPRFDIDIAEFMADPYPTYARLHREAPIAFCPQLGSMLITRRDDISVLEKLTDVFSSDQPQGLMTRLMGLNLMRKDGAAHLAERRAILPAVSPRTVAAQWRAEFQRHADRILDDLAPLGHTDLHGAYALPLSGECLKSMTGLTNISFQEMDDWSQAMIAGISNYGGDAATEARCHAATAGIDAAIDARLREIQRTPDLSLLSVLLRSGLPMESVRANVKLAISGGQNEPRHTILGCTWAMLTHPDQLADVRAGSLRWLQVFEEYVRWMSPIGMSPRRIATAHTHGGVTFEPEMRAFLMFAAANRDPAVFDQPNRFDSHRDTSKAIAFGAGPHFCAGAAASRAMIADVALPSLFARLPDLALDPSIPVEISGWAFRGLQNLQVMWRS
jgi:cytochrome P450